MNDFIYDFSKVLDILRRLQEAGPKEITWDKIPHYDYINVSIDGTVVAVLEVRPQYCDRGHFSVKCFLPDIDSQDGFPRYYMSEEVARAETEAFLKWRIWKIRGNHGKKESNKGKDSQTTGCKECNK
jgi:hypothetical protein